MSDVKWQKPAEFLRTDEPPVVDGIDPAQCCDSCRFWSRWLPETGDCLLYAMHRRDAIIAGCTSAEVPPKAARTSSAAETCRGWVARDGRGLSR